MCNVVARKIGSIRSIKMIQYTLFIIASVLCAIDMVSRPGHCRVLFIVNTCFT
jgi:hypothetical protein